MAIKKIINIDGIDVPFKASAAVPHLYRMKFQRDIYKDFAVLQKSVNEQKKSDTADVPEDTEENISPHESGLDIESLEVFENLAWTMAHHADPENVPDDPNDCLESFNVFSIYEVLPKLIELWGLNTQSMAESKKKLVQLTEK
jgi:hypothetical protein